MPFAYSTKGIEDLDSSLSGGSFEPLPDGIYEFQITDTNEKTMKNGDPMVNATCEVVGDPKYNGRNVWHNITFPHADEAGKKPKWAGMGIHFLKTIGCDWENDFIVTPDEWVGKRFKAKTKTTEYNGKKKNELAYILGKDETVSEEVPF